jgi:hypothetical protein
MQSDLMAASVNLLLMRCILGVLEEPYSIFQKSVAKSRFLENAIDLRMGIKTITYSDVPAKALPALLARTFANHHLRFFLHHVRGRDSEWM